MRKQLLSPTYPHDTITKCKANSQIWFYSSLREGSPRAEMRACYNHGGKSINAHLISIRIIYKTNQSYSFGSPGEYPYTKRNPKM